MTMQRAGSILIVSSRRDPASANIARALITKNGFEQGPGHGIETYSKDNIRLVMLEKLGIYTEPSDIPSDASTTIFVCKHVSSSRSEEHTSELQSRQYLVCRLLLEKKK